MFIGETFYKCDAFIHARLPEEVKQAFRALALEKDKTASEYVLDLILRELHQEGGGFPVRPGEKTQTDYQHDE